MSDSKYPLPPSLARDFGALRRGRRFASGAVAVAADELSNVPVPPGFVGPGGPLGDDEVAPPTASTPIVTGVLAGLVIEWDGLDSTGAVMPRDFRRLEVHISTTSGFTPSGGTLKDTFFNKGKTAYIPNPRAYVAHYVKFVTYDWNERVSGSSAQATGTPQQAIDEDLSEDITVTAEVLDGSITTLKLADEAVTNAKVSPDAITNVEILDGTIVSASIGTGAILTAHILDGNIINAKIADGTILSAKIGDAQIVNAKIGALAVTQAKIGDGEITSAKIVSLAADKITAGTIYATVAMYAANIYSKTYVDSYARLELGVGHLFNSHACIKFSCGQYIPPLMWGDGNRLMLQSPTQSSPVAGSTYSVIDLRGDIGQSPQILYQAVQHDFYGGVIVHGQIRVEAQINLNNETLYLSGLNDGNHQLKYYSTYSGSSFDGPILSGYTRVGFYIGAAGDLRHKVDSSGTYTWGNVAASGSKTFKIPHPTASKTATLDLVHAAVEGPESAVIYRGVAVMSGGKATVTLPDYFEDLTLVADRTVHLTRRATSLTLSTGVLAAGEVSQGKFTITSSNPSDSGTVCWMVMAVRKDIPRLVIEPPKGDRIPGGLSDAQKAQHGFRVNPEPELELGPDPLEYEAPAIIPGPKSPLLTKVGL